jgi:hypothetical protein
MGESMSIPASFALDAEIVGALILVELDCTDGVDSYPLRFVLNDEASFTDTSGNLWWGAKLISIDQLDFSIGGDAPAINIRLSYTVDPYKTDLITLVRQYGSAAVRYREAKFYLQYIGQHEEIFAAVNAPVLLTTRRMMNLNYFIDGPKSRAVAVGIEGPFDLRSKPVNGRYTDADHKRCTGTSDPSLEFMPTNNSDEQSLFGL